jgi:hypothetical protein
MIIDDTGELCVVGNIFPGPEWGGVVNVENENVSTEWEPYKLHHMDNPVFIERFAEMHEWLTIQTSAFRMNPVTMTSFNTREAPQVLALMIQLPETLGVLFKLYWYSD